MRCPLLVLVFGLGCLGYLGADEPYTNRVAKLIAQLGSADFGERESATRELDALGAPALEALKQAVKRGDAETRRRAEELVARIEKRLESRRILAPTPVTLSLKNTPLAEAVAELAKQSGQPIVLGENVARRAERKVTVSINATPFWPALEQFCRAANLAEAGSVSIAMQRKPVPRGRSSPVDQVSSPARAGKMIVLIDGPPQALPTHHAGAARVQALPPSTQVLDTAPRRGEILFALGLALETEVPLRRVVTLHIDKALDDQGQSLEVLAAGKALAADADAPVMIANVKGRPQAVTSTASQHQVPLRLKRGAQPSKLLRELSGTLAVEVLARPEAEPTKLSFVGRRPVVVEIPFTLHDVPLP